MQKKRFSCSISQKQDSHTIALLSAKVKSYFPRKRPRPRAKAGCGGQRPIPCRGPALDGLDALLSTVQMPSGIPVACVGIGNGANAALLAAQILAVEDAALAERLAAKREADREAVLRKDAGIAERL